MQCDREKTGKVVLPILFCPLDSLFVHLSEQSGLNKKSGGRLKSDFRALLQTISEIIICY
jgi:hypothetical protein